MKLRDDPRPPGSVMLTADLRGAWRIRVGDYRIGYIIEEAAGLVRVVSIGHRSTFYKRMKR